MIEDKATKRYFFTHVMKTGGTSLVKHAWRNLGSQAAGSSFLLKPLAREGIVDKDIPDALGSLAKTSPELLRRGHHGKQAFFAGHMPRVSGKALDAPDTRVYFIDLLRDPVERVCSHLLHACHTFRRQGFVKAGESPEALYGKQNWRRSFAINYQVKQYSLAYDEAFPSSETPEEEHEIIDLAVKLTELAIQAFKGKTGSRQQQARQSLHEHFGESAPGTKRFFELNTKNSLMDSQSFNPHAARIEIDSDRLDKACQTLEITDTVGLTDTMDEMFDELFHVFGWQTPSTGDSVSNRGPDIRVSTALRKRIARDNEADIEFYHYARKLVARRRRDRTRNYSIVP